MLEKAYDHYNWRLRRVSFVAWLKFFKGRKDNRNRLHRKMKQAQQYVYYFITSLLHSIIASINIL